MTNRMSAREIAATAECRAFNGQDWCGKACTDCLDREDIRLTALRDAGFAVVPMEPTEKMTQAAYTTLSLAANPQMWPSQHSEWNANWIKNTVRAAILASTEEQQS